MSDANQVGQQAPQGFPELVRKAVLRGSLEAGVYKQYVGDDARCAETHHPG